MKKIAHPEFTVAGYIMLIVGAVFAYIGYFGADDRDTAMVGIGLMLLNTGILVLRRYMAGTIMMVVIFIVLASSRLIFHTEDYSTWFFLRMLFGGLITSSIVWLQFRYHNEKNLTEQVAASDR